MTHPTVFEEAIRFVVQAMVDMPDTTDEQVTWLRANERLLLGVWQNFPISLPTRNHPILTHDLYETIRLLLQAARRT